MPNPTLVVMAAGMGSRFGGLKQVEPVGPNGETVLSYAIHDALNAGFDRIVFVIRKETEALFRERVGKFAEQQADTAYVFQELDELPNGHKAPQGRTKPWGTAHAVLCCKDAVRAPFAVINADDYYGQSSYVTLADYLRNACDTPETYEYCMVGFLLRKSLSSNGTVSRGVCTVDADDNLVDVVERTRIREFEGAAQYTEDDEQWITLPDDSLASLNMWGFGPSLFDELDERFANFLDARATEPKSEFFIPAVVSELLAEDRARVRVLRTDERWFGVTYREDLQSFRQAIRIKIREGIYPESLWDAPA